MYLLWNFSRKLRARATLAPRALLSPYCTRFDYFSIIVPVKHTRDFSVFSVLNRRRDYNDRTFTSYIFRNTGFLPYHFLFFFVSIIRVVDFERRKFAVGDAREEIRYRRIKNDLRYFSSLRSCPILSRSCWRDLLLLQKKRSVSCILSCAT